jgi:hypothetical protein
MLEQARGTVGNTWRIGRLLIEGNICSTNLDSRECYVCLLIPQRTHQCQEQWLSRSSRAPALADQAVVRNNWHCQLNCTPLYSPSMAWHTCPMKAAPQVRSARFSSSGIIVWSCHEHLNQPV